MVEHLLSQRRFGISRRRGRLILVRRWRGGGTAAGRQAYAHCENKYTEHTYKTTSSKLLHGLASLWPPTFDLDAGCMKKDCGRGRRKRAHRKELGLQSLCGKLKM